MTTPIAARIEAKLREDLEIQHFVSAQRERYLLFCFA
jgi:hypothetical protein